METFKKQIERALQNGLPGEKAQNKMMPESRNLFPKSNVSPRMSAVLILFYPDKEGICFPLIRRPTYEGAHSGQMAFPGGKQEENESLEQTALRESFEEIGVDASKVEVLGSLSDLYIPVTNMMVKPFIGIASEPLQFNTNPMEVEMLHPIKLADLKQAQFKQSEQWKVMGVDVNIPFYYLNGQKVWGATAMMLSELENILGDCCFLGLS